MAGSNGRRHNAHGELRHERHGDYSVDGGTGTLTLTNIAPGDAVKFTLSITNNSNISIKYQIRMPMENKYVGGGVDPAPESTLSSKLEISGAVVKTGVNYAGSAWSSAINGNTISPSDIIIRLPRDAGNDYASKRCDISLTVLAVQSNARETSYCDENGHYYEKDSSCLYCGAKNLFAGHSSESDTTYTITGAPAETTDLYIPGKINGKDVEIAQSAFKKAKFESVTFAEGIKAIPEDAFNACSSLTEVNLPDGLVEIGKTAFYLCPIESLDVPGSVQEIGEKAFYQFDSKLTSLTLHEGLLEIGASAFENARLTRLEIPDSVTTIGSGAFNWNNKLEHVLIGTGITKASGAFDKVTDTCVFECKEGATTIDQLFSRLTNKFEVTTKKLYDSAKSTDHVIVVLPDTIEKLAYKAFYQRETLISVTLPENLKTIDEWAFNGCTALQNIVIPDSVTKIGTNKSDHSAFEGCSALKWVVLPAGLETFYGHTNGGESAHFNKCTAMKDIYFKGSREQWEAKSFYANINQAVTDQEITVHCTNVGDENYWDGDVSKLS